MPIAKFVGSLDSAVQLAWFVFTVMVTVSPAADTVLLDAEISRDGVLPVAVRVKDVYGDLYAAFSTAVAVMVVVPSFRAVISPVGEIVATLGVLDE